MIKEENNKIVKKENNKIGKKILIIEDNIDLNMIYQFFFEDLGYEVETALNGKEAIDKISKDIEIVLLDIMMPEVTGYDVLNFIEEKKMNILLYLNSNLNKEDILGDKKFKYKGNVGYFNKSSTDIEEMENIIKSDYKNYYHK